MLKEQTGGYAYGLCAADNGSPNRPSGNVFVGGLDTAKRGTSALPTSVWSQLAVTYDGSTLRLYVNGTEVSSRAASGLLTSSSGATLRIGGNAVWGRYFRGRIDEVRIYDRALSAGEVVADRDRAVSSAAPFSLGADGARVRLGSRAAQTL